MRQQSSSAGQRLIRTFTSELSDFLRTLKPEVARELWYHVLDTLAFCSGMDRRNTVHALLVAQRAIEKTFRTDEMVKPQWKGFYPTVKVLTRDDFGGIDRQLEASNARDSDPAAVRIMRAFDREFGLTHPPRPAPAAPVQPTAPKPTAGPIKSMERYSDDQPTLAEFDVDDSTEGGN